MNIDNLVSVILLAGGTGSRMNATTPKQYLPIGGKPIVLYSFELFASMPEIQEIIVVCDPSYAEIFSTYKTHARIGFALPGIRRQDSVFNGFSQVNPQAQLICVHDGVRPFITADMTRRVLKEAQQVGAATAGMPIRFTVKECTIDRIVKNTPDRSQIWEIQTPQAIQPHLLKQGFAIVDKNKMTVTDDVSLAELIPHPVKLVEGHYSNIKITTPEDLALAESLLISHGKVL